MNRSPKEVWVICRVPRAQLCYVRYVLESYEGLCIPTTLKGREGRVRLSTSADRRAELDKTIEGLAEEIPLIVEGWGGGVVGPEVA